MGACRGKAVGDEERPGLIATPKEIVHEPKPGAAFEPSGSLLVLPDIREETWNHESDGGA
jgi:hypothetical protein